MKLKFWIRKNRKTWYKQQAWLPEGKNWSVSRCADFPEYEAATVRYIYYLSVLCFIPTIDFIERVNNLYVVGYKLTKGCDTIPIHTRLRSLEEARRKE